MQSTSNDNFRIGKFLIFSIFIALCVFIIPTVSAAASVTVSPDTVQKGDKVTVQFNGINDGSKFSILVESRFDVTPGSDFTFETNNFYFPISLTGGDISAYTENTQRTRFAVKKGDNMVVLSNPPENGIVKISKAEDIGSGTYDYLTISGTAAADKNNVVARFQLTGKKTGPDPSTLSFNVGGIDNGRIILTVFIDDAPVLEGHQVTIGKPSFTSVISTPVATSQTIASSTPQVTSTSGVTQAPASTTAIPVNNQVFTSVDGAASLTTSNTVSYAGLLKVTQSNVPDGWIVITEPYAISPGSLTFDPAATLTFTTPSKGTSGADYAYFIGQYQNGAWAIVPSVPADNAVKSTINGAGTYALMALKSESSIPAAGSTVAVTGATQSTVTTSGTPKIASVAYTGPATTAKPAPLSIIPVIGAGLLCILIYKRSKQ